MWDRIWINASCVLEAGIFVTKLVATIRRVRGPEHSCTKSAKKLLERCKERHVVVMPHGEQFQALRYENDEEICVLKGPIAVPRRDDIEEVLHVDRDDIHSPLGCSVICSGLVFSTKLG